MTVQVLSYRWSFFLTNVQCYIPSFMLYTFRSWHISRVFLGLLLAGFFQTSHAREFVPFQSVPQLKLTGFSGYTNLEYQLNDQVSKGTSSNSHSTYSTLRGDLSLSSQGFIFHPNFITLDVGGGPTFESTTNQTDFTSSTLQGANYNFRAMASFLREKPYRGSVFFERANPSISLQGGQTFTLGTIRYGGSLSLLEPVLPIPLEAQFIRTQTEGSGSGRNVNDISDTLSLATTKSLGELGTTSAQYSFSQQDSSSGSQDLAIQNVSSTSQSVSFDHQVDIGDNAKYHVDNRFAYNTSSYSGQQSGYDQDDMRFNTNLRAKLLEELQASGQYSFNTSTQSRENYTTHGLGANLAYTPNNIWGVNGGVTAQENTGSQFRSSTRGVNGSAHYFQELPIGSAVFNYGAGYSVSEQVALSATRLVSGESIVMSSTIVSSLSNRNVVGAVRVWNLTRTQEYVEGFAFKVTTFGTETRLVRLIAVGPGSIFEGENVLVDYSFDVGGSNATSTLGQNLNADWTISEHYSAYFRYSTSTPTLTSGFATTSLNKTSGTTIGTRTNLPVKILGIPVKFTSNVELESRQESNTSFRRLGDDYSIQTEDHVFGLGSFRVGMRHETRVSSGDASQTSTMLGYDISYWAKRWFGIDLSANASFTRSSTNAIVGTSFGQNINAGWQLQKFSVTSSLSRINNTQDSNENTNTVFRIYLRRNL